MSGQTGLVPSSSGVPRKPMKVSARAVRTRPPPGGAVVVGGALTAVAMWRPSSPPSKENAKVDRSARSRPGWAPLVFASLAPDASHVLAVPADGDPALAPGLAGLPRREFVRGTLPVGCPAAHAGDRALSRRAHAGETAGRTLGRTPPL